MSKKYFLFFISCFFSVFLLYGNGLAGSYATANYQSFPLRANLLDTFKHVFQKKEEKTIKSSPSLSPTPPPTPLSSVSSQEKKKVEYTGVGDYEQMVIKAIERSSPAVVSVIISKDVPVVEQYYTTPLDDSLGNDPLFKDFFGGTLQIPQVRQKGIERQDVGGGSGFIISSDGLIVTNKHVVTDVQAAYTVLLNNGKKFEAKVLARDPYQDVAVLKIETSKLPILSLGDSNTIKIGQTAIAIGNSLGEFRNTASVGIISGLARTVTASGGGITETLKDVLQTDAAINQGNSGGPLLNLRGEVVGVNVAVAQGAQSIGFAIPINKVKRAIQEVKTTGKISSPYLGVRHTTIDESLQEKENLGVNYGALVRGGKEGELGVLSDSPAQKGGVKEGDIILEINAIKITKDKTLTEIVSQYKVGDTLTLKILRGSDTLKLRASLEQRPNNF